MLRTTLLYGKTPLKLVPITLKKNILQTYYLYFPGIPTMLSEVSQIPEVKINDDFILKFEIEGLTDFGKQVAEKELRETPEVKKKAIEELKKLLEGKFYDNFCIIIIIRRRWTTMKSIHFSTL